ncbi:unnamed protein product [Cyprideis torosa]|uniref:Sec20 C-terminal domain-containing protein n=1 Tax=Cyprideis torosa TaxID=163714 RepID=A0A7R8W7E7_9CRUS|nr:unnamed protein product [Cyprideis torosa]CAG0887460.1 unnamed protein product [Cyprideis torosa]
MFVPPGRDDAALVHLELEIKRGIQEIRTSANSLVDLNERNFQLQRLLKRLKDELAELEEVSDPATEQDVIKKHREELQTMIVALRKANLEVQLAIDRGAKRELLGSKNDSAHQDAVRTEGAVNKSRRITEHLTQMTRSMAEQVEKSHLTVQTLVSTSQVVEDTQEEFKSQGQAISQASKLLTKYGRREFTDKVLIFMAVGFFLAVVLYVVQKRLF